MCVRVCACARFNKFRLFKMSLYNVNVIHTIWTYEINLVCFLNFLHYFYQRIMVFCTQPQFCCPVGSGYLSDGIWNAPAARQLSTFILPYRQGHDTDATDVAILSHAICPLLTLLQMIRLINTTIGETGIKASTTEQAYRSDWGPINKIAFLSQGHTLSSQGH